jgi:glycine/D-amino acid oxidase-like deaminating enzyme
MLKVSTDFAIIGGGSTGTSIAYHLQQKGLQTTLIEWNGISSGNTGKSSALVRTHYSNETVAKMALYSLKFFETFDHIGYSGFTKTGMIYPFQRRDENLERKNMELLGNIGVKIEILKPESLMGIFPEINLENFDFITYEKESGYADPTATANSFANGAKSMGSKIILGKMVISLEKSGSETLIHLEDGTQIFAKTVILASNVWTNKILENSGVEKSKRMPIIATKHSVIYLRRPSSYIGSKPTLWDMASLSYYKMEGETLTAIGSLDPELDKIEVEPDESIFNENDPYYLEKYVSKLAYRLPPMGGAGFVSTVSGLYDMTPDGEPIIDNLFDLGLGNVYICAGLSGHGFKLSPALGKIVLEMCQGKEPDRSTFDWSIFNKNRFKNGKQIQRLYDHIGTIY